MTARSPGLVGAVVASLVQCRCVAMTPGCRSSRRSSSPSRASWPAGRRPPTTSRTRSWPQRRFASCGAADPASGTLYAFGGRGDDGTTHHGDLWALDLGDRRQRPEWHRAAEAGAVDVPPPVRSCAAAWEPRRSGCWCSGDGTAAPTTAVCARSIRPPERGPTCARSERAVPVRRRGGPRSSSSIRCVSAPCCSAARAARTPTSSGRTTSSRRPGSGSPPPARSPAVAIRWSSTRAARWCGCSGALVRGPTSMTSGVSI